MAVLVYRVLHGTAPSYLTCFRSVDRYSAPGRRGLIDLLTLYAYILVPRSRCVSLGARAFPVAGDDMWNSLPPHITSAPSLSIFRRRLRTFLFNFLFPGSVI
jgi:hypothetical protein